jgi:hypothetical protein
MWRRAQALGMSDLRSELRDAFEGAGYAVDRVSQNRDTIDVGIRSDGAEPSALREVTEQVCGASAVLGFDVTQETSEGTDAVGTIVSFRHRP